MKNEPLKLSYDYHEYVTLNPGEVVTQEKIDKIGKFMLDLQAENKWMCHYKMSKILNLFTWLAIVTLAMLLAYNLIK